MKNLGDFNIDDYNEQSQMINKRREMVEKLKLHGILRSNSVYQAMLTIPRHWFVPKKMQKSAYQDSPLPIGNNQTISAPHMHAMMCEYLEIQPGMKILEIGTGSGYHTALLSFLVTERGKVYTIERIKNLTDRAESIFSRLNLTNIYIKVDDGTQGWLENSPFDRILVTAAGPNIPQVLIDQLSPSHGKICIPVGDRYGNQELIVGEKRGEKFYTRKKCYVRFVPLIGKFGFS
ncbi:MAG: protein-L-isoaspartate(D-aspartate) O-methyltransferase [Candidatus Lokiarchaeota archaeon]|nr:protein-L-isoaspartate(D-aspartate) O-methyltransferase [Candidatus Harpocratesius repetitus]